MGHGLGEVVGLGYGLGWLKFRVGGWVIRVGWWVWAEAGKIRKIWVGRMGFRVWAGYTGPESEPHLDVYNPIFVFHLFRSLHHRLQILRRKHFHLRPNIVSKPVHEECYQRFFCHALYGSRQKLKSFSKLAHGVCLTE